MNQDSNNLNQNNFNTQGNKGILNNQPLQNNQNTFNQNLNVNQPTFNNQQQVNTNYQQPINQMNTQMNNNYQQPLEQSIQNNNNFNMNTQPVNNKPKKNKLGLIIVIILVVCIVITLIIVLFGGDKYSTNNNSNNIVEESNFQYLLSNVSVKFSNYELKLPCKAQDLINKGLFSKYNLSNVNVQKYFASSLHDSIDGHSVDFSFTTFTDTIPLKDATVSKFIINNNGTNAKLDGINIGNGTYKEVLKKYGKPDEQTTEKYVEEKLSNLPPNSYYSLKYSILADENTDSVYSKVTLEFQIINSGKIFKIIINWAK